VTWELLTWRRPWDELVNDPKFISWRARQRIEEGSARLTLPAVLAVEKPELATLLSRCLDLIPENRPTAEEVVQVRANFSTSHPHHHHTSWSHRMKFAQYWSLHDSDILTDLVIASVQLSTRSTFRRKNQCRAVQVVRSGSERRRRHHDRTRVPGTRIFRRTRSATWACSVHVLRTGTEAAVVQLGRRSDRRLGGRGSRTKHFCGGNFPSHRVLCVFFCVKHCVSGVLC
jgi:serine/threonine protein kinase